MERDTRGRHAACFEHDRTLEWAANMRDRHPSDPQHQPPGPPVNPVHIRRARRRAHAAHEARPHETQARPEGTPTGDTNGDRGGPSPSSDIFRRFAHKTATGVGSPWSFAVACAVVAVWAVTGPVFHFSDTRQLVINTGTTIVTFLMVFLIQNTQNRDAVAIHLKLDELIRAVEGARTRLVHLEDLSDDELGELQEQFKRLHDRLARHEVQDRH
jgi:low affinity Fe/Cu permease